MNASENLRNVKSLSGEQEVDGEDSPDTTSTSDSGDTSLPAGGITTKKGKHSIHCLTIIGQIEGHYILPAQNKTTKYEHVIPQLLSVEQDPEIEGLVIILNTVGGDVEAGLAIAELLSGMKKPTVSLVLGGGHSIGVPLAVSARRSFIVPSATMTVHPVRMNGLVLGIPQTLSYFDKMQERIINFITDNSRMSAERFRMLMMNKDELVMDVGTVLDGQAAVDEGLIDSLGGIADVIAALYEMIEQDAKKTEKSEAAEDAKSPKSSKGAKPARAAKGAKPAKNPRGARKI